VLARMVAEHMTTVFGQQFYVESRPGAGGLVGVQTIAHADPDGYNFVITTPALLVTGPLMKAKMGYDPKTDLTNIAYLAGSPGVIVVNPKSNIATLADFVATGKRNAHPLSYSASGAGSNGHLLAEAFAREAGIKIELIPYKGAAQGIADLIGAHIDFSSQSLTSASAFIRAKALTPIAHSGSERFPDYPDVPTFAELGYPSLVTTSWFALAGPAGLSRDIVSQMNREIVAGLQTPEAKARLLKAGMVALPLTPAAYEKFLDDEFARWRPVIESLNIKVAE
jgi:tripartite-type tricarboxylate transporter receptor subunit TctC